MKPESRYKLRVIIEKLDDRADETCDVRLHDLAGDIEQLLRDDYDEADDHVYTPGERQLDTRIDCHLVLAGGQ